MEFILAAIAALMGGAGVASAAAAAHATADPRLATMAQMLMIHAAAVISLIGLGRNSPAPGAFTLAAGAMLLGVALFAGDLASRIYLGGRLFPMAAPTGGSLTILAWGLAAIAAILSFMRR